MTHGRTPRRPRPVRAMAFFAARNNAARLTSAEIAETMAPFRLCEKRLREGAASEDQHAVLYTAVLVALGIEQTGIVRGLRAQFAAAEQALASIRERATKGGAWRATALYADELAAVREALDLHQFQLSHLSAGELHAVARKLIARTQSSGGNFTRRALEEITS